VPDYHGLASAIFLSIVYSSLKILYGYHKDWCGFRLLPGIMFAAVPSVAIVSILYIEFARVALSLPGLTKYWLLISFFAAMAADFVTQRTLVTLMPGHSMPLAILVEKTIVREKLKLIKQILNDSRCCTLLQDLIVALPSARRGQIRILLGRCKGKPDQKIVTIVVEDVGLYLANQTVHFS